MSWMGEAELGSGGEPGRGWASVLEEAKRRREKFQRAVLDWSTVNLRDFPWRRDRTAYKVLVSEILLRRTTASAVLRIYEDFMRRFPDAQSLVNADVGELESALSTIGYHKLRARMLKEVAKSILEEYNGSIPASRSELLRIPHIGPYVAGAILSLGYGKPAAMVDSNVQRILGRVFRDCLPPRPSLDLLQGVAEALVPEEHHEQFNLGLLDLGALVCRYDKPRCTSCPLNNICDSNMIKT
jgi:A/G-specific adenine glycosylase